MKISIVFLLAVACTVVFGKVVFADENANSKTVVISVKPNTIVPVPCDWHGEQSILMNDGDTVIVEVGRCPVKAEVVPPPVAPPLAPVVVAPPPVFTVPVLPPPAPAPERQFPEWAKLATWALAGAVVLGGTGYMVGQNLGPERSLSVFGPGASDTLLDHQTGHGWAGMGIGIPVGLLFGAGAYALTH